MDDIISLGLETMEVQTVRLVSPQHFEQYWQAGVLANKTNFEMNLHGHIIQNYWETNYNAIVA